jgi:hypothetical protein
MSIYGNDESDFKLRNGILFQDRNSCEQVISSEYASNVRVHGKNSTNIITMESNDIGRTGNHFIDVSQYLGMGFCCKSGLVELPATDEIFPSLDGGIFKSDKRFFDFSDVKVPQEFENLSKRVDVCPRERIVKGDSGLNLPYVHNDLRECINRVYVRGCEAAYFGDVVRTDTCQAEKQLPGELSDKSCHKPLESYVKGTESLVVHIRSGDIFFSNENLQGFGQPPLQYYLDAITSQAWSSVTILTFAKKDYLINPAFIELENMNCRGELGNNVRMYKNRDWLMDMRSMICADAILMSKSSTHCMTLAFTKAKKFFVPTTCGSNKKYKRGFLSGKRYPGNTNVINAEFPDSSVYGIEWGDSEYSVYKKWENTAEQYEEIVNFTDMNLKKCEIGT